MNVVLADRRLVSKGTIVATLAGAILFLLAGSGAGLIPHLSAQEKKPGREVIRAIKPYYPAIVKNARIEGTVRLNAIVLPNGTVSRVQIVGGNPILADSAVKAVMKWKYAAASTQTSEEVVVNFNSNEVP
jgi:TonB family protein